MGHQCLGAEALHRGVGLQGENDTDCVPGDGKQRYGTPAGLIQLIDDFIKLERRAKYFFTGLNCKEAEIAGREN